jgi:hypothetical protein
MTPGKPPTMSHFHPSSQSAGPDTGDQTGADAAERGEYTRHEHGHLDRHGPASARDAEQQIDQLVGSVLATVASIGSANTMTRTRAGVWTSTTGTRRSISG